MFYRINWHAATRRVLIESNKDNAPAAIGGSEYVEGETQYLVVMSRAVPSTDPSRSSWRPLSTRLRYQP